MVKDEEEEALKRIRYLEKLVEELQRQLVDLRKVDGVLEENLSLEEVESKLKEAYVKLMNGEEGAQEEFDAWDKRLSEHPGKLARDAELEAKWEEEQAPLNQAALEVCHSYIIEDIKGASLASLIEKGIPKAVASRIWEKKCLWLTRMDKEFIAKLHIADLNTKFTPHKLDHIELRALYCVLPESFENDSSGEKKDWRYRIRAKLKESVERLRTNPDAMSPDDIRHKVYFERDPVTGQLTAAVSAMMTSEPEQECEEESKKPYREKISEIIDLARTKHEATQNRSTLTQQSSKRRSLVSGNSRADLASKLSAAFAKKGFAAPQPQQLSAKKAKPKNAAATALEVQLAASMAKRAPPRPSQLENHSETVKQQKTSTSTPLEREEPKDSSRKFVRSNKIGALLDRFEANSPSGGSDTRSAQVARGRAKDFQREASEKGMVASPLASPEKKKSFQVELMRKLSSGAARETSQLSSSPPSEHRPASGFVDSHFQKSRVDLSASWVSVMVSQNAPTSPPSQETQIERKIAVLKEQIALLQAKQPSTETVFTSESLEEESKEPPLPRNGSFNSIFRGFGTHLEGLTRNHLPTEWKLARVKEHVVEKIRQVSHSAPESPSNIQQSEVEKDWLLLDT